MRGLFMSIESSAAAVLSSTYNTGFQVAPPPIDLYTPRSFEGIYKAPCAAAETMLGSFGSMTMRAMCCVASSPIFFHVLPTSVDRSEEHTSELQSPYVISYAV